MHIHQWKFCPFCGSEKVAIKANAITCSLCQKTFYENIAVTCSIALYTEDGSVVFCERANEPYKGMYDLPGGYADPGEVGEDTIAREVREELDFDLDKEKIIFLCSASEDYPTGVDTSTAFLNLSFTYQISAQEFRTMKALDDVASVRLVPQAEIAQLGLAWKHDAYTIREMIIRGITQ